MAVTEQTPLNSYTANGATTVFAFSFLALQAGDLTVQVDGATKALGVHYTVAGLGVPAGGTVTFLAAPSNGAKVVVFRDSTIARSTDYQNNGDLLANTLNDDFDRLWLTLQEIWQTAGTRALRVPYGESSADLPTATARASKLLGFDSSGVPLVVTPNSQDAAAVTLNLASSSVGLGSKLVAFIQRLTGAVARWVEDKLAERLTVTDFTGVDPTGVSDSTTGLLAAEAARAAGRPLIWPVGTYKISADITSTKAGAWIMEGVTINATGARLVVAASDFDISGQWTMNFAPGSLGSEARAVRVSGALSSEYGTTGTIAVGDTSFAASSGTDAATLSAGDWVIVINRDPSNWIQVEYKQVISVAGTTINVAVPFAQAFDGTYPIKWVKITTRRQNVKFLGGTVNTTDLVTQCIGFDLQPGCFDVQIRDCNVDIAYGLAANIYGVYNPTFERNIVRRQGGRRTAVSSCHGGSISDNQFENRGAAATNGALTVETGTFGTSFRGNRFLGGTGGAGVIYHNNARFCTYTDNLLIGDAATIGFIVGGASDNTFDNNTVVSALDGYRFVRDTAPATPMDSNRNVVTGGSVRKATNGVNIGANAAGNTVAFLDCDSTVTTPVADAGTGTAIVYRDPTTTRITNKTALALGAALIQKRTTLTWAGTIAVDASLGSFFDINAIDANIRTIGAPTNGVDGQRLTITVRNTSGGALGAFTWDAAYKMAAWTAPGNGFSCSIEFRYNGTNWVEIGRGAATVPN